MTVKKVIMQPSVVFRAEKDIMIRLLHVEDDADIREIAKMALELSGEFDVLQCSSGEEALATVVGFKPDVILLDMMMPGMTGRQTLEEIRQLDGLKETPAIFMTARAQHAEIEELLSIGAVDVISKPFDPMSLADSIKSSM
ncbi:Response regulator receiver domain-containing protein [Sulfitobacter brevis]|uniref:Response regulator receiver domain-containing protein n=2 Tax=Sulfitobacter brevis TaxID=74348 RepID=A0A1I2AJI9_9RHOB|nr:Response regulator receiver domain-containing protein [Sulfitobacter brevis]